MRGVQVAASPHCPQQEYGENDTTGTPKDGTVHWSAPTDLSRLEYSSRNTPTEIGVSGSTVWKDTYQCEAYGTHELSTISDPAVQVSIYGTADLAQSPPTFTTI